MEDIRIAFVGDSFVNGTGDPEYLGWVNRICQKIQNTHQNLELTSYNLGVRRETSYDILQRNHHELNTRLIDGDSFFVVYSFGVNDCVIIDGKQRVSFDDSAKNLHKILEKTKKMYKNILFVMPPPIADNMLNKSIEKLITMYISVCNDLDITFINKFEDLKKSTIWQKEVSENDGAHPQSDGYNLFAQLIYEDENWLIK